MGRYAALSADPDQANCGGFGPDEERVKIYRGFTKKQDRESLRDAFNAPPEEHPLRILIATDAAREGLNLQAYCHHLFHFDVPWNPSRMEQRNGRIDRKLQPSPGRLVLLLLL
jgi:SNF2 family DNA or RNA helicase